MIIRPEIIIFFLPMESTSLPDRGEKRIWVALLTVTM